MFGVICACCSSWRAEPGSPVLTRSSECHHPREVSPSLLFPRLSNPGSLSPSSEERGYSPFTSFVAQDRTPSPSHISLSREAQNDCSTPGTVPTKRHRSELPAHTTVPSEPFVGIRGACPMSRTPYLQSTLPVQRPEDICAIFPIWHNKTYRCIYTHLGTD